LRRAIDALLLVGTLVGGGLLVAPAARRANLDAEVDAVGREARLIYEAFDRYYAVNSDFPNAWAEPALDPETLEPLRRRGYYTGTVQAKLLEGRIDGYDSPDDRGTNQEFWLEMTLARDPSIRFLIARSDDAPMGDGQWRDGAFVLRDGALEPL